MIQTFNSLTDSHGYADDSNGTNFVFQFPNGFSLDPFNTKEDYEVLKLSIP